MLIRAGYEISLKCDASTPMMALLSVHPSRAGDLRSPSQIVATNGGPMWSFSDQFGNVCTRTMVPAGTLTLSTDFVIEDSGQPDPVVPDAEEVAVENLPDDVLKFL